MYNYIHKKIKKFTNLSIDNISFIRGLTLVELLVVIGIFLMITSTVIFNYGGFRSNISLQNLTDDIAMSIRKAQSFAIGARGVSSDFSNSYGMHFSVNPSLQNITASRKSFLMFTTVSTDRRYIVGTGKCGDSNNNTCIELFNINNSDIIKEIALNDGTQIIDDTEYLDIIFTRPDPRAFFCYRTVITGQCEPINISNVSIKISNGQAAPDEKTKTISVQNTGQISISN